MPGSKRIVLHVDMDSFYASVEMREDPGLRGLPVVVGADPKGGCGRGVVSTCSYEARRFGIHSAMPISQAYARCPHAVYLRPRISLYSRVSESVMQRLRKYAGKFQQVSIDEAYLDVSDLGSFSAAQEFALLLKAEIRKCEGLNCSVGIGPSKVVAKIASDHRKPDGLMVVEPAQVREFLAPLAVGKIPGVGRKTGAELNQMGITTISQLAGCDVQQLLSRFGRGGIALWELALGNDEREVQQEEGSRSISRETTFPEDTGDTALINETIDAFSEALWRTLAEEGLRFRTLSVKVRYQDFATKTRSHTLSRYSSDRDTIRNLARKVFSAFPLDRKIRLIGVRLSSFDRDTARQASLGEYVPE